MFDRFDNWLMDKLVRLYVAAVQRRQRRMGRGDPNCFDGVRIINAKDSRLALFQYVYRITPSGDDKSQNETPWGHRAKCNPIETVLL